MGRENFAVARLCLIAITITMTAVAAMAAGPPPSEDPLPVAGERWAVRVVLEDRADVDRVASWLEPWEVDLDEGYLIVDVGADELKRLRDLGFQVSKDEHRTAELNRPFKKLAGQKSGIPGFPCYRTVEETLATGAALAAAYPELATWIDIGDSWEKTRNASAGYDLMVLRLTNSAVSGDKPRLWVEGAIHARELATAELVTRFAEYLLAGYDVDPDITWLLDHHEIHLLLHTNPDGRKMAEAGASWRKNTNNNTCDSPEQIGVDLNRNFSYAWACCGGSSDDGCALTYRGINAASEPETQAVQDYVRTLFDYRRPDDYTTPVPDDTMGIFIDVHAYGSVIFSPWGFTSGPPPNSLQLLRLGRRFGYLNGYEAQTGGSYTVDGDTTDFAYGELGIPGYTFEIGVAFFEVCEAFPAIEAGNIDALLYAAKVARAPYTIPAGPDVVDPAVNPIAVEPGGLLSVSATIDDTRVDQPGSWVVQPIAAGEMYVDLAPWQDGAIPVPLSATDSFDNPVETVDGVLDTTGLALGRHTLYLRGLDEDGSWGPVSALFFWVLDPLTAPQIAGRVTSAADLSPLTATVAAGPFSATSDPASGAFAFMVAEGTYNVTATAPGHGPQTSVGLDAAAGESMAAYFQLAPNVLTDDVEDGNIGWTADSPWAITSATAASPSNSWTDSPAGSYANRTDASLTSPQLDLSGYSGVTLEFGHIYDLQAGGDFGQVEYSTDDGASWTTAASYTGKLAWWGAVVLDLAALDGAATARIRFRLVANNYGPADGWYIDDIAVQGKPSAGSPRRPDGRP